MAIRVYAYATDSGEPLGEWDATGECELAFAGWGFDAGSVSVPRGSSWLRSGRLLPGGGGVTLRIDATEDGAPSVALGEVESLQAASGDFGDVSVRVGGPAAWLSDLTVPAMAEREASGATILAYVLRNHPGDHRLRLGRMAAGRAATIRLDGQSIWDLLTGLEKDRGELFRLEPLEDALGWWVHLGDGLEDATDRIFLEGGLNCGWSLDIAVKRRAEDLTMVGYSMGHPSDQVLGMTIPRPVMNAQAPHMPDVGAGLVARQLAGQGPVIIRPDLVSPQAVELALRAAAARLPSPALAELEITTAALWPVVRPQQLVSVAIDDEPTGLFERCIGRVLATSYKLGREQGMKAAVELWPVKGV